MYISWLLEHFWANPRHSVSSGNNLIPALSEKGCSLYVTLLPNKDANHSFGSNHEEGDEQLLLFLLYFNQCRLNREWWAFQIYLIFRLLVHKSGTRNTERMTSDGRKVQLRSRILEFRTSLLLSEKTGRKDCGIRNCSVDSGYCLSREGWA